MHYLEYWSLTQKPFGTAGRRFFAGSVQREALARLHYIISDGIASAVLLSPSGCGMTSLFRHVAESQGIGDCAVEMLFTEGGQPEHDQVVADLAGAMRLSCSPKDRLERIDWALASTSRQRIRSIWLIDGCGREAAALARRIVDRGHLLSVVMGTEPRDASRLAITLGQCPLKIELPPWGLDDTAGYIRHALETAGSHRPIFSDSAAVRLHEIGQGRVGIITSVAELAMIVGAANRVEQIGPAIIEAAQEEMVRAAA